MRHFLFLFLAAVLLVSCAPALTGTPLSTVEGLPAVTETAPPPVTLAPALVVTPSPAPSATVAPVGTRSPDPSLTPTPTAIQTCGEFPCTVDGHFLFQRPIASMYKQSIERSYPYAFTQDGMREPHHGVEFYDAQGTPVLAAAAGKVIFAGDDKLTVLSWVTGYYGNVVVIEHHFPGFPQTFYTLYAHLYKVDVNIGQEVLAGEQIGQVGATGTARGSHLHFEVRITNEDYKSTRNPELWLAPLPETGVLAGQIVDAQGVLQKGHINIQRIFDGVLEPASVAAVDTYVTNEAQPINSDDTWQENFAIGELPAGGYRLTLLYNGGLYEQVIKIEAGRLTLVKFVVK
jgi:hypothetical protein